MKLDQKDKQILEALMQDASLSVAKLARKTDLPSTTVYNRVKKLKDSAIIQNYTIEIDKKSIYGPIIAYILIKTHQNVDQRKILQKLSNLPNVLDVSIITGRTDIISKIQLHSIEALDSFILDEIRQIEGIINSETMIALENVTSKSSLPNSLFID